MLARGKTEIFIEHLGRRRYHRNQMTPDLRVDLNVNFRSVKPILDFANKSFQPDMTSSFAGIDYDGVGAS